MGEAKQKTFHEGIWIFSGTARDAFRLTKHVSLYCITMFMKYLS